MSIDKYLRDKLMSEFKNGKKLWKLVREHVGKDDPQSIYTMKNFVTDAIRIEGIYVNENLSDPILYNAKKQINAVEKGVHALHSAIEKFKKNQDIIEVCREIASIEGIETDSFETGLLDATELLGLKSDSFETGLLDETELLGLKSDSFETRLLDETELVRKFDPLGAQFRNFCEIRRYILPLRSELKKENPDKGLKENLTPIKNKLSSITSTLLQYDTRQIEAIFINEAANRMFNPLFESKVKSELNNAYGQSWKSQKNTQKDCFKKFLKLFLHQNFIFSNACILNKLGREYYRFCSPTVRRIELSYADDTLFIQESFLTQRIMDLKTNETFETTGEDFFVKGTTKYKINISSYNEGWLAKYALIDSTLECEEKFKAILDTRTILEKFREFLEASFDKIIDYLNLDKSEKNHSKFKPIFFVSDTGSSVSQVICDKNEYNGNILNIKINSL